MSESAVQLLGVARVRGVRDLAACDPGTLNQALIEINGDGKYFTRLPNEAALRQWIESAQTLLDGLPEPATAPGSAAPAQGVPAVETGPAEMASPSIPLGSPAPLAVPTASPVGETGEPGIPVAQPAQMMDQQIAQVIMVGDEEERRALLERATEAIVVDTPSRAVKHVTLPAREETEDPTEPVPLNRENLQIPHGSAAVLEPRVINPEPDPYAQLESIDSPGPTASMRAPAPVQRKPLEKRKIKSFEDYESGEGDIKPLPRRESLQTDPKKGELKKRQFKNPNSKLNIKGVLYPSPGRMFLASLIVIGLRLSLLTTIVGTAIMFAMNAEQMKLLLPVYIFLVFFFILYITYAVRTRCRICSCPLLFSRNCHKHKQAHRVFLLGLSASTALHAVLFRWFRCMYCGTSIRLKE